MAAPSVADVVARAFGAEQDRAGRIKVGRDLTLPGHPEVSAVGDVMSLDQLPGVAEVAMQAGFYAGRRIRALEEDRVWTKPFRYHDLGSAAYISRGNAVVSFKGVHLAGRLGWVAWLGIHLMFLTSFRNRLGALITWALTFSRESRRERAFSMQALMPGKDIYEIPGPPAGPAGQHRSPDPSAPARPNRG